jgi:D-alanyl-D-alanine carboxypeptidase
VKAFRINFSMNRFSRAVILLLLGSSFALASVPPCTFGDQPAPLAAYDQWQLTLVDTSYRLPADYVPPDLVSLKQAGFDDDRLIRSLVIQSLSELRLAAEAAGHPLEIQSAYRSHDYQKQTFDYWVALEGEAAALASSARAGHSEHQLGTTLDFRSAGGPAPWDLQDWGQTPAGGWLQENAVHYGFVQSYPAGKTDLTCYIHESWHYRFVGAETARAVQDSGLTLREWLWLQQP